jgi:hypothetical protein
VGQRIGSKVRQLASEANKGKTQNYISVACDSSGRHCENVRMCDGTDTRGLGYSSSCYNTRILSEGKKRKGKKICGSYLSLALHASLASYSEFRTSCLRPKCPKSEP